MVKKSIIVSVIFSMIMGITVNSQNVIASEENIEKEIKNEIENVLVTTDIEINNLEIDLSSGEVEMSAEVDETNVDIKLDTSITDLATSDNNIIVSETKDNVNEEYSIFYGTLQEKNEMDNALLKDEKLLKELEKEVLVEEGILNDSNELVDESIFTEENPDKNEVSDIKLSSEQVIEETSNVISSEEELVESPMVITNQDNGEIQEIDFSDGVGSFAFSIPVGIIVTTGLVTALIKAGSAMIVGGVFAFTLSYISKNTKTRSKNYNHYGATLKNKVLVSTTGGLSYNKAVARLLANADVWSTTQNAALNISKSASPLSKSTSVELHGKSGSGYFKHYHPAIRKVDGKYKYRGSHSFFGTPA